MIKGYAQVFDVDYSDTFAPVARLDTIRLLLVVVTQKNWRLYQLDVKSAFMNAFLQEGYVKEGEGDKVSVLKIALYGLKQASKAWYSRINVHLLSLGFKRSLSEPTLYVKYNENDTLVIPLYVDDLLVTGNNADQIREFKQQMMKGFQMTDLGLMAYFLGMKITQDQGDVFICQMKYAREIRKKFHMEDCKGMSTPMILRENMSKEDGSEKVY